MTSDNRHRVPPNGLSTSQSAGLAASLGIDWLLSFGGVGSSAEADADSAIRCAGRFFMSDWMGPFDAIRHCVWACSMTADPAIGKNSAADILRWNERGASGVDDREMDNANNAMGRAIGALCAGRADFRSCCCSACMVAFLNGELIFWRDGRLATLTGVARNQ
jgi:hypothetical protein